MSDWRPEHELSIDAAAALVTAQFPQLAPVEVRPFGAGWDNTAYLVNARYVFRFPRRQLAAPFMETESRALPALAPLLPVPIPAPLFVGQPAGGFPWAFAGYALLPGRTACRRDLDDAARARLARPIAAFLRALHAIRVEPAMGLPPDTFRRLDVPRRRELALQRLDELRPTGLIDDEAPYRAILDLPISETSPAPHAICHGDLYARHVLVDDAGDLSGIIDWGDIHRGDPAVDLCIAYTLFPPAGRREFFDEYGAIDSTTVARVRLRALGHTLSLVAYAHETKEPDLMRESVASLRNLTAD